MQTNGGGERKFRPLVRLTSFLVVALSIISLPFAHQCGQYLPRGAHSLATVGGLSAQSTLGKPTDYKQHNHHHHDNNNYNQQQQQQQHHLGGQRARRHYHHSHNHLQHNRQRHYHWNGIETFAADTDSNRQRRQQQQPSVGDKFVVVPGESVGRISAAGMSVAKFKRQVALDLAVNKLHILESLDAQLREFADSARRPQVGADGAQLETSGVGANGRLVGAGTAGVASGDQSRSSKRTPPSDDLICYLPLARSFARKSTNLQAARNSPPANVRWPEEDNSASPASVSSNCLDDPHLRRQIPPYMLNLHHQLVSESRSLANAVRLMPYQSLVVRSFRQPSILNGAHLSLNGRQLNHLTGPTQEAYLGDDESATNNNEEEPNVVVELSALSGSEARRADSHGDVCGHKIEEANNGPSEEQLGAQKVEPARAAVWEASEEACNLEQRLMPTNERRTLCYRFKISEQLRRKINGSLELCTDDQTVKRRERLVEAELHLFKLPPEMLPAANEERRQQQQLRLRANAGRQTPTTIASQSNHSRSSSSSNLYHLKTNLLEVSLFQILPKRAQRSQEERKRTTTANGDEHSNKEEEEESKWSNKSGNINNEDLPLRLLDIRRIDMESSGWETFYIKRAVEDWMRDSSLNLGLVIKAKSMFEEPIKIGLIRFADLYDHHHHHHNKNENNKSRGASELRLAKPDRKEALEFDSSHQPILVVYTTTTQPTRGPMMDSEERRPPTPG